MFAPSWAPWAPRGPPRWALWAPHGPPRGPLGHPVGPPRWALWAPRGPPVSQIALASAGGLPPPRPPATPGGLKPPRTPRLSRPSASEARSLSRARSLAIASSKRRGGLPPPRTPPANYEGAPPPQTPPRFTDGPYGPSGPVPPVRFSARLLAVPVNRGGFSGFRFGLAAS